MAFIASRLSWTSVHPLFHVTKHARALQGEVGHTRRPVACRAPLAGTSSVGPLLGWTPSYTTALPPSPETPCVFTSWRPYKGLEGTSILPRMRQDGPEDGPEDGPVQGCEGGSAESSAPKTKPSRGLATWRYQHTGSPASLRKP